MVSTWSPVGGFSVMSRSKGSRGGGAEAEVAGASLAAWVALVAPCLRRLMRRGDAGALALWKRVTMSRVLRCEGGWVSLAMGTGDVCGGGARDGLTYEEHVGRIGGWIGLGVRVVVVER